MEKKDLLQVNIHEDYCLWNMLIIARNSVGVLQDYVQQHRQFDNGKAFEQYKKVIDDLQVYEHYIALMLKQKED